MRKQGKFYHVRQTGRCVTLRMVDLIGMAQEVDIVREFVRQRFTAAGLNLAGIEERLLIRANLYCGRRFLCQDWSAMWLEGEAEITLRSPQNLSVSLEISASPVISPLRRAA